MKIAVLGAGAWGTALGINLGARHAVALWARDPARAADIQATRRNARYFPDYPLPPAITASADLGAVLDGADLVLVATSTSGLRETLRAAAPRLQGRPLLYLCKGFEADSGRLPHQIAGEELPPGAPYAVVSGPSFADEVARGLPTALTVAAADAGFAQRMARDLHHERLRVYSSTDVVGVEVAGAVKNVMAIAAGVSDGLGLGYNARAALMTRGLAEITRLGLKLGGRIETFIGLAGAGDLVLTCTGDLSRNRTVGLGLAQGLPLSSILGDLGHAAEGVYTARAVDKLAREQGVDMPITRAVCRVMDEGATPREVVGDLLARDPKPEPR